MSFGVRSFAFLTLTLFSGVAQSAVLVDDDVLTKLRAMPRVAEIEETTLEADYQRGLRRFVIQFSQEVDHSDEKAGRFNQRLVLFHRDFSEPMVLQTSGYKIFRESMTRLATAFSTNQLQIEHRFFENSTPKDKDWTKLTIRQSAEDFHKITESFKTLYTKKWVGTGASKGGMTSVYHRRFFPNDLDGTVADVAPLSFSVTDQRYIEFVDTVGGEKYAGCREKLEALQNVLLARRAEILPKIEGEFTMLGEKEIALEHAVIELPFIFWQYGDPTDKESGCDKVPGREGTTDELYAFLKAANDPVNLVDSELKIFQPYFFQAAFELGGPDSKLKHIKEQLKHPYEITQYLPDRKAVAHQEKVMRDIERWVATEGKGLLFVYGEFDPWSAGAFRELAKDADNHWFEVPGGNHGAKFDLLPEGKKKEALAVLARWFGKQPTIKLTPSDALFIEGGVERGSYKIRRGEEHQ